MGQEYNEIAPRTDHSVKLRRKKKAAIVEDLPQLSSVYHWALQIHGYEVVLSVNSGEECMEAVLSGKLTEVDHVLLDYNMKGMNGLEVARALSRLKPTMKITIASASDDVEKTSRSEGFDFLRKPFTLSQLLESAA
jgi:DNA-binding NtrC family response regulator